MNEIQFINALGARGFTNSSDGAVANGVISQKPMREYEFGNFVSGHIKVKISIADMSSRCTVDIRTNGGVFHPGQRFYGLPTKTALRVINGLMAMLGETGDKNLLKIHASSICDCLPFDGKSFHILNCVAENDRQIVIVLTDAPDVCARLVAACSERKPEGGGQ